MKFNLNTNQIKFFASFIVLFLLLAGCKKQNGAQSGSSPKSSLNDSLSHGRGAILNRKAFLSVPEIDINKIRTYLKAKGISPRYQLYNNGRFNSDAVSPLPNHPQSVILNHPPVGNQLNTPTCVSWAVGYCDKEVLDLTWKNPTADVGLRSGWFLYNKIYSDPQYSYGNYGGCQPYPANNPAYEGNGLITIDALNYAQRFGVASITAQPNFAACTPASTAAAITSAASDKTASAYGAVTNFSTAEDLIAAGLPVVFVFAFYNDFQTAFDNNTPWNTLNSPSTGLGHAVCLIGYDDSKGAFLAQNSWGIYGAHGYGGDPNNPGCIWISYGVVQQLLMQGRSNGGAEAYSLEPIDYSTPINSYYNTLNYQIFSPAGCTGGLIPNPSQVVYEVPANRYLSPVSVAAANAVASNDVLTNGQTFANNHLNGCVVPPGPPQNFNFVMVGDFAGSSNYNLLVNGYSFAGPQTMGTYQGNMLTYVNTPVTAMATVVVQITSGYMPTSAIFEGTGPSTGVINASAKTITFNNVAMWGGQTCEIIMQ